MPKLKTILNISLLLLFSLNLSCQDRMVNILYVLPKNYEGPIIVLYGQKDGKPKEYYSNDWRVYRINEDGTLKTRFEYPSRSSLIEKYCYIGLEDMSNWLDPLYIYDYPDKWGKYPPRPLEEKKIYSFGISTNMDHCGFATYQFCGFTKDTIKKQIDEYRYMQFDNLGHSHPSKLSNIISSLRSPCK